MTVLYWIALIGVLMVPTSCDLSNPHHGFEDVAPETPSIELLVRSGELEPRGDLLSNHLEGARLNLKFVGSEASDYKVVAFDTRPGDIIVHAYATFSRHEGSCCARPLEITSSPKFSNDRITFPVELTLYGSSTGNSGSRFFVSHVAIQGIDEFTVDDREIQTLGGLGVFDHPSVATLDVSDEVNPFVAWLRRANTAESKDSLLGAVDSKLSHYEQH